VGKCNAAMVLACLTWSACRAPMCGICVARSRSDSQNSAASSSLTYGLRTLSRGSAHGLRAMLPRSRGGRGCNAPPGAR